ncbi:MAG: ATP synthase F1 subunit gamma [Candidatus Paceibacterota bacterium]
MASTKEIKRRIKSVKNTKKITKAMELVAASKMKKAVTTALSSRVYSEYSWEILSSLRKNLGDVKHPFFSEPKTNNKKHLLLVITSNRGLCGAYNAHVLRQTIAYLKKNPTADVVTIGKKGENMMKRIGQNVIASFTDLPELLTSRDTMPIAKILTQEFSSMRYEKVVAVYTDFVSPLVQKVQCKQLLPIALSDLRTFIDDIAKNTPSSETSQVAKTQSQKNPYFFEGDTDELIASLARKIIRTQVYQMLVESNASEQSARMIAMKNASEASGEMINDLTLVFNKARQAGITQEISEISAGMASVN